MPRFWLSMKVVDGAPPPAFASAIPAMFEALLDVFAPLDVRYRLDGGDFEEVARIDPTRRFGTEPLWCDEELTRGALTRCGPALGTDVIAELHDRFAGVTPATCYVTAIGAVFHRSAEAAAPAWYGRWRSTRLHELVVVSFRWTAEGARGFELSCPHMGYPLSSIRLRTSGKLDGGDAAIARENRALVFPALCKVRAALGFDHAEVAWRAEGDDVAVKPVDRQDMWKHWLPQLRES